MLREITALRYFVILGIYALILLLSFQIIDVFICRLNWSTFRLINQCVNRIRFDFSRFQVCYSGLEFDNSFYWVDLVTLITTITNHQQQKQTAHHQSLPLRWYNNVGNYAIILYFDVIVSNQENDGFKRMLVKPLMQKKMARYSDSSWLASSHSLRLRCGRIAYFLVDFFDASLSGISRRLEVIISAILLLNSLLLY